MYSGNKYFLNDKYIFDASAKSLTISGEGNNTTWLGSNESNILLAFIERPNQILSRDQIHQLVWTDNGFHVDESSVIQAISTLRKILKDSAKDPGYIKTIPKHGYQFIAHSKKIELEDNIEHEVRNQEHHKTIATDKELDNAKQTSNANETKKKFFDKKSSMLLLLIAGLMLVFSFWFPTNIAQKKYARLQQVDVIKDINIYVLNPFDNTYNLQPEIKHCVTQLLHSDLPSNTIDKIIVSSTSRNELVINVIDRYLSRSVSYTLISKNLDMQSFCDMRFANVKK
ncbi:winged helix-turn-helix domain-containing protein [Vibrio sp. TH_r3]|uniref:winged helix-turn-helix domain-containing protein n=1 Tax=Vibrio sp. TH_r3 TaxID=3082084 RepID=UPI0029552136|nr:winged helix-turn-helix domain-containing protein [Vibrio sp. TH_r3]MDV7104826.1 winged helix-turn-helix domain-containing protein [Vibrio sp. TH_r3]